METIQIRFVLRLESEKFHGPAFHRWLPNGENDAINLVANNENTSLKIWFKRFGYTDDMVQFSLDHNSIEETVLRRQGILQGGPLFGELKLNYNFFTRDQITLIENYNNSGVSETNEYEHIGEVIVSLI